MSLLFFTYSLLILVTAGSIYALTHYVLKREITLKDLFYIGIGVVLLSLCYTTVKQGINVNAKLSVEFKVPKDVYSDGYNNDSTLSDKTLYNYLLDMRVPHPKIVLCQAKIESADYSSVLYKRQFNLFGMKIPSTRATSGSGGKAGYQGYNNWMESVTDYILWQYSHNADKLNQDEYLLYLGKIYAEDPKYVFKIKKMLKEIDFSKLEN